MTIPFTHNEPYHGPVQAVVLDWAGTAVDHGSLGPLEVFRRAFASLGVAAEPAEIRPFMGLKKIDHVRGMFALESMVAKWRQAWGTTPGEAEVEHVYALLEPMMVEAVADHATPIPGLLDTVAALRRRGIGIGSCTGYTRSMMEVLVPAAARQGYAPDFWTCSTDVPAGRPFPWMCYQNALALETYPMAAMLKVGDTVSDIHEGLNAGMWCVGVTRSGVELGLSVADAAALPREELQSRLQDIGRRFKDAGAHYVIGSVADLLPVVDALEERLLRGELPLCPLY